MMSRNYTVEQKDLKAEVKGLQQQLREQEQQAENIEQFVQRLKRSSALTELTPYILRELVKAVYVDAPDKSSGKRRPASWKAATTKPKLPSVWATVFATTIISFYLFSSCRLPPRFREEPFYYPTAFRDEPKTPRPHAAARKQTRILLCI